MNDDNRRNLYVIAIVLVLLYLVGWLFTSPAHAIKRSHMPTCMVSQVTEACHLTFGSTDSSGFVIVEARPSASANAGASLVGIFFTHEHGNPVCSARVADEDGARAASPVVKTCVTSQVLELELAEDARLPRKMRWFYTCKEEVKSER